MGNYTIDYWKSKGIKIYKELPKGWYILKNTMTHPRGTVWISNNKSFYDKEREHALLIVDKEAE